MGQTQGLLRIYADRPSGRLLGAEMIGPKGENLAHSICWSIAQGLTVGQMLRLPFYHPVMEEALQAALYDAYRQVDAKNPGGLLELEELAD
jgi:dihydrolipoamide dehydrogenase